MKRDGRTSPFVVYTADAGSHEMVVVQTGMGTANLMSAFDFVVEKHRPDCIVSAGFGGAIYRGASAGEVVLAKGIYMATGRDGTIAGFDEWEAYIFEDHDLTRIQRTVSSAVPLKIGNVITVGDWTPKARIRAAIPEPLAWAVCDMESFFFARMAEDKRLPFVSLRSISDCEDEDVPEELMNVTDVSGNYDVFAALRVIVSRPRLLPAVITLARNSRLASENLALCLSLLPAAL